MCHVRFCSRLFPSSSSSSPPQLHHLCTSSSAHWLAAIALTCACQHLLRLQLLLMLLRLQHPPTPVLTSTVFKQRTALFHLRSKPIKSSKPASSCLYSEHTALPMAPSAFRQRCHTTTFGHFFLLSPTKMSKMLQKVLSCFFCCRCRYCRR